MQTNPAILTPQHDCWDIFVTKLNAALTRQPCTDTPERPLTRKILTQLAQHDTLDVNATLRWFAKLSQTAAIATARCCGTWSGNGR